MNPRIIRWILPVFAATAAFTACSGSHHSAVRTAPEPATSGMARARADSVRHPYVQADVDFMSHMIGHHAQALV